MLAVVQEYRSAAMTGPEPSDDALVAETRAGSRKAFEALVRRYQKPVFFLCLRYVRDRDEAADLAQRTFIRAFAKVADLRGVEVFRTWLFRIGINLALNHLRDHARFVADDDLAAEMPIAPVGTERLQAGEQAVALRRAVEALPTKQRMTLELRIYEELPFKEVAEALGTSEGAAKVNFHYAVRKLRALLAGGETPGKTERP
jgi:RNA polymerase sigma-70 factor, ECF subfamily